MAEQIHNTYQAIPFQEGANAYAELRRKVTEARLLDRTYGFYALLIGGIFLGFFTSLYFIYTSSNYILLFFWSIIFAFFAIQCGGIVHDGGHRAITKSVWWNNFWGLVSGGLIALGFNDWRPKHNEHHAHTNQLEEDPDIDIPLLSFTEERLRGKKGWQRLVGKYQVYFYYPIGLLSANFLRIPMIKFTKEHFFNFEYTGECLVWFAGAVVWYTGPFIFFALPKALLVFFTVHLFSGWYVMHIFAPNHKGMPEIDNDVKMSFIEQQIITSRNINPHPITDFLYMGLNYQIEHHLFPACPRPNLGKLSTYVKAVCKKYNWEYTSCSVIQQDIIILKELVEMSRNVYKTSEPAYSYNKQQ